MRILFTRFPLESAYGGAEKQTICLMLGLIARGHEVSFLGSCPVLLEECKRLSIDHCRLSIGKPPVTKWGAISFPWRKGIMQQKLIPTFDEYTNLDAIFMLSLSEKILLTPHALSKKTRVFWQEHDTVGNWLIKNPWLRTLKQLSANITSICVSELSANIFRKLGYKNVVAIPNGVNIPAMGNRQSAIGNPLTVGCIARLSPEKGIHVLLEAMEQIDGALIINGVGAMKIEQCEHVTVIPRVDDIEEMYNTIDVLVLPSVREDPFGLVVAEAMMRGIATICTDVCGIAEFLTNGVDTLIVPAGDSEALKQAIVRMQNLSFRTQIAKNGQKTAQEKFTIEKMVDGYERVICNT